MRSRLLIAVAAALALALSLAACSDDGDGDDASTDETTEAEADTTETESSDDTMDDETTEPETETTEAEAEIDLTSLLLTPADIGDTFVEGPYEPTEEPGPCGTNIDTDHPYDDIAGVVIGDEEAQLFLQHEIRAYADEATAGETFAAAQEAFSCGAETEQPGLTLSEVTDVTADLGGDAAALVEFVDQENAQEGAAVFVQVGPAISVYQFVGPAGSDDGPDPAAIVAANIEAIEAALA